MATGKKKTAPTIRNADIADALTKIADLLELEGANPFRVRAYRRAARTIHDLPHSVAAMVAAGEDLTVLPGIGKELAAKLAEIVETGHLSFLDRLAKRVPESLADLMHVPGLGAKRVALLHERLGVRTREDLLEAIRAGRLRELPGFGAKSEQRILEALQAAPAQRRIGLLEAEQTAEPLLEYLRSAPGIREVMVAGSYRRRVETIGDLDVLVTCRDGERVMRHFASYPAVERVVSLGPTRATVLLRGGFQVDVRAVAPASRGAAWMYFTGSKAHNIALRRIAVDKGLKLNEYGLFRNGRRIAGAREADIYRKLGLAYVEPELREDRGEIDAARSGGLPQLVRREDLRGDLHVHTKASDGYHDLRELAEAARAQGLSYVAITDHTKSLRVARGLDADRLRAQLSEIDRLNERLDGITILKGAEVDILEDGSLDLPDSILRELDLAVCAVHSFFDLPRKKQTERILRAIDNPYCSILAHPTCRLLSGRPPIDVDIEKIVTAAAERGCILEVNSQPDRLDLTDVHCQLAKETGALVAITTDAHKLTDFGYLRFGIWQARRGWIEAGDVINTRPIDEVRAMLRARRD